jgi:hypothetical protein
MVALVVVAEFAMVFRMAPIEAVETRSGPLRRGPGCCPPSRQAV